MSGTLFDRDLYVFLEAYGSWKFRIPIPRFQKNFDAAWNIKKIIFPKLINLYLCVRKDYDMWGKKANVNMIQILIQSSFRMDLSKTKNCFAVNESKWEILLENMDAALFLNFVLHMQVKLWLNLSKVTQGYVKNFWVHVKLIVR